MRLSNKDKRLLAEEIRLWANVISYGYIHEIGLAFVQSALDLDRKFTPLTREWFRQRIILNHIKKPYIVAASNILLYGEIQGLVFLLYEMRNDRLKDKFIYWLRCAKAEIKADGLYVNDIYSMTDEQFASIEGEMNGVGIHWNRGTCNSIDISIWERYRYAINLMPELEATWIRDRL